MVLASAGTRREGRRALRRGVGAGNVEHNLELEKLSTGGNRVRALTGVRCDRGTGLPGLEGLLGHPLGDYEIAILALDRPEQLEPEEAGLVVDRVGAVGETLSNSGPAPGGTSIALILTTAMRPRLPSHPRRPSPSKMRT